VAAYRAFLADPQPRSRWCAQRNRERWSPLWRPFEGPLSLAAQRQAVTILKNLYAFWVDKNYVMGNPWTGISAPRSSRPRMNNGRSLTVGQWRFVLDQAARLLDTSSSRRLRFALSLLYATGMRLSEAVAARVDHLEWVEYPPDDEDSEHVEGWLINVVGKGGRLRQVPVPTDVVRELSSYLESRGLDTNPVSTENAGAHLLGKASDIGDAAPALQPAGGVDPRAGLAANTLYDQVKGFFKRCAQVLLHEATEEVQNGSHARALIGCATRMRRTRSREARASRLSNRSRACIVGHHYRLCDDRGQAAHEGDRLVLAAMTFLTACVRATPVHEEHALFAFPGALLLPSSDAATAQTGMRTRNVVTSFSLESGPTCPTCHPSAEASELTMDSPRPIPLEPGAAAVDRMKGSRSGLVRALRFRAPCCRP
jgi:integrase